MKLEIYYDSETDTLSLWNGQPADDGADVAENLTVDFNGEGEVVGFTLEHAAELLTQFLTSSFDAFTAPQAEGTSIERPALEDSFHAVFLSAMDIGAGDVGEGEASFSRGDMFSPPDGSSVWYIASSGSITLEDIIDNPIGGNYFSHVGHLGTETEYIAVAGDINQNVFDRLWQTAKDEDSPVLLLGMPGALPSLMEQDHDHPKRNPASQPNDDAAKDGRPPLHSAGYGHGDCGVLGRGG